MKPHRGLCVLISFCVLCGAAAAEDVLFDQTTLARMGREIGGREYQLWPGAPADRPIVLTDKVFVTPKPALRPVGGLPKEWMLHAVKGRAIVVPDATNIRLTGCVANTGNPAILVRWRDEFDHYAIDFRANALVRAGRDGEKVLAKSTTPLLAPEAAERWRSFEVTVEGGSIRLRMSPDAGATWQTALEAVDPLPLASGAVVIGRGEPHPTQPMRLGDLAIVALPSVSRPRDALPSGPAFQEALMTAQERMQRDPFNVQYHSRQDALDYLARLPLPAQAEVSTALAVAECDQDIRIRLAAWRAKTALGLDRDVLPLLLAGLQSKAAVTRRGAVTSLLNLKATPEQVRAAVVDGLLADERFARQDVKRLVNAVGNQLRKPQQPVNAGSDPFRSEVVTEIVSRYASADAGTKAKLLRALGRDSGSDRPLPGSLDLLAQALDEPAADVRAAALRTIRWLETPLAWMNPAKPNVFQENPAATGRIAAAAESILAADASAACRAEAAGCLAALRRSPKKLIVALADKEPAVRAAAAQGLCSFPREQVRDAVPALERLVADPVCGVDAKATLSFITDSQVEAAFAGEWPPRKAAGWAAGVSTDDLLAETRRLATEGARMSVAMQAERVPFPDDLLAHASANLCLNRNRAAANEWIQQEISHNAFGDMEGLGGPIIPTVFALHWSGSRHFPGRLTAETEALFKESLFSIVDWASKRYFNDYLDDVDVMKLPGTENQSLTYRYGLWFSALSLLAEDPAYAPRVLRGGKTVAEYAAGWNAFMQEWMRTRAINGLWIELGAGYAGKYSLPALFSFLVTASDPQTRDFVRMFIDLAFIEETQASFGDVRGGSKSRIKEQGIYGTFTGFHRLFYEGVPIAGKGAHQTAVSGYQMPAVAVLLRHFEQFPAEPIEIVNRRLGEVRAVKAGGREAAARENGPAAEAADDAAQAVFEYTADSRLVNYIWKTRHVMLGSVLGDPTVLTGPAFRQRQWNGLVFADGSGLYPNSIPYYSFQHRNVLIVQKEAAGGEPMYVFISPKLRRSNRDGWTFVDAGAAYAAIKVVRGGAEWNQSTSQLVLADELSPLVIVAGDADTHGSLDGFMAALGQATVTAEADTVEYAGPRQTRIRFFAGPTGTLPSVDGTPFTPSDKAVYASPFMRRQAGERIVTVEAQGRRAVYDFDTATVVESAEAEPSR